MFTGFLFNLFLASAGIFLVTLLVSFFFIFIDIELKPRFSLTALAAGFMLGSACFFLIPEAFEMYGYKSGYYLLAGFLFLFVLERFVLIHVCDTDECHVHRPKTLGATAFIGLSIHSLSEGLVISPALTVGTIESLIPIFAGILIHKTPCVFSLSSLLLHDRFQKRSIVILNVIFAFLFPVGGMLYLLLQSIMNQRNISIEGPAMAFGAGTFFYIAFSDLIPQLHKQTSHRNHLYIWLCLGICITFLLSLFTTHEI